MKTSSAKAKGRRLQQQFMQLLIEKLDIDSEDIESRSMGAGGEKGLYEPLVVIKKNGVRPLVVLDAENFLEMIKDFNNGR